MCGRRADSHKYLSTDELSIEVRPWQWVVAHPGPPDLRGISCVLRWPIVNLCSVLLGSTERAD